MENIFLSKQVFAKLRLIRTLHVAANVTTPGKSILNTIHSFNRFLDSTIRSTWKFPCQPSLTFSGLYLVMQFTPQDIDLGCVKVKFMGAITPNFPQVLMLRYFIQEGICHEVYCWLWLVSLWVNNGW